MAKSKKPVAAFNPNPAKRPVAGFDPPSRKLATSVAVPSPNTEAPAWRIARLDFVDPFGWHMVHAEKLHEIRIKLAQFEAKTWNDILVREKHWNHTVSTEKMSKEARERLASMKLDDVEELVSLRLTGPERVWGYRIGFVLHVLWWDPGHRVCPSALKHT